MSEKSHFVMTLPNGDRLGFVRINGHAPGLLVVGGYGKSALEKPIGPCAINYAMQRGQACVVLEFRSQGRSSQLNDGMSVPGMRDDILAAAHVLGLRGFLGIGASLGAWAMLAAHQRRPDLLWGMVGLAPALDWDLTYFKPLSDSGQLKATGTDLILAPESGIAVSRSFFSGLDACRIDPATLALPGPLHVIHGTHDTIAPIARSERLVAEVDGRLIPLSGAGHEVSALQSGSSQAAFVGQCDAILGEYKRATENLASELRHA